MAKKKKNNRALLVVALVLLGLVLFGKQIGLPSGFTAPLTPPGGGGGGGSSGTPYVECACEDPFEYIVRLPEGECQCVKCVDVYDSILIEADGTICCIEDDCSTIDDPAPTTTLPVNWCQEIYDSKECYAGVCEDGMYCISDLGGGCYCEWMVN